MHKVVALTRPPQGAFELACAAEVFGTQRDGLQGRYDFRVCAEEPGPLATNAGYTMYVDHGLSAMDTADTVVIPGWRPADAPLAPAVRHALLRAHDRGARLVTLCGGAFALAQTGLLDGRAATTHWAAAAELAELFPQVRVDRHVLYVDHGDVATSGGAGAGIDLCLHLVRADHGAAYAARLARQLVMPPHREGGQAQYAPAPVSAEPPPSVAGLLDWITARLAEPITLEHMAAHLRISPRTLARWFADQLGTSPGRWLLAQRIAATRALLEETDLPVETIAQRVGLMSATNLRRRFHTAMRTTPASYRRTFRINQ